MKLKAALEKWIKDDTKYVTKCYLIMNYSERRNIELFYKYEKEDEIVENKIDAGIGVNEKLSKATFYNFIDDCNDKFNVMLANHIEENWEQEIFDDNPNYQDAFDIAYYSPISEKTIGSIKSRSRLIISDGKRLGDQILSRDKGVNLEVAKDRISIIGWSHQ